MIVDAHFWIRTMRKKAQWKSWPTKKTEEQERSKERSGRESNL